MQRKVCQNFITFNYHLFSKQIHPITNLSRKPAWKALISRGILEMFMKVKIRMILLAWWSKWLHTYILRQRSEWHFLGDLSSFSKDCHSQRSSREQRHRPRRSRDTCPSCAGFFLSIFSIQECYWWRHSGKSKSIWGNL